MPENTPADRNVGDPVAAVDPEGSTLVYSLMGADADAFSVVSSTGQIRTSQPLNFEPQPSYSFTIQVHDREDRSGEPSTLVDDSQSVTITIENVEEPGEVTLVTATETIQARVEVTAELADDDIPTRAAWQWSRSPNGRTGWVNIANATSASYTPTLEEDQGQLHPRHGLLHRRPRAQQDRQRRIPPRRRPAPVDSAPAFPSTENGQREAPEDTAAGQIFGDPVAANNLNDDALTYSLSGPDAASFEIDASSGQLRLASNAQLDFEAKRTHRFTVQVTDSVDQNGDPDNDAIDDTINVVVNVTDVNEAPVVTGDASPSIAENESTPVATYTGTDPERDTLTWSVSNDNDFWISDRGQLYFRTPPSFEGRMSYQVAVTATDDDETTAPLAGSFDATVTVTDAEEEGTVVITPPRGWVDVPTQFTPELTDGDGGETGITWQWARSSNRSTWVDIPGATSRTYTASTRDLDHYLRATAAYTDRRGSNKTASAALMQMIGEFKPATNAPPEFEEPTTTRSIGQGPRAGRSVGAPVKTTDPNEDDVLTYSLQGPDADNFDIDAATGQIRTKDVLDSDVKDTYSVTVSVHDGFDDSLQLLRRRSTTLQM